MSSLINCILESPLDKIMDCLKELYSNASRDDFSAAFYGLRDKASLGECDDPLGRINICIRFAEGQNDNWLSQAALHFKGEILFVRNQHSEALEIYQEVVENGLSANSEDGFKQAAIALANMTQIYLTSGQADKALEVRKRSIELEENFADSEDLIISQLSLVGIYRVQEDFKQADALLHQLLKESQQPSFPRALVLIRLGESHEAYSEYEAALSYYDEAIEELFSIEEPSDFDMLLRAYIDAVGSTAMILDELEEYDLAVDHYRSAIETSVDISDRRLEASLMTWLGTSYLRAEQPELAKEQFDAAKHISEKIGFTTWLPTIDLYSASAAMSLGRSEQAIDILMASLQTLPPSDVDRLACLMRLGEFFNMIGRHKESLTYLEKAINELEQLQIGQLERTIHHHLGVTHWNLANYIKAYNTLQKGLRTYEDRRRGIRRDNARVMFAPSRHATNSLFVKTCLKLGKYTEAFETVDEAHSRVLTEQLSRSHQGNYDMENDTIDYEQILALIRIE